ncbi:hypothetical protein niasHT_003441 [Heterodera trifolii]|uniref:BTB domain-containing protein n=1 Tax=Heterodera trifolii TaxID=157864 RepID=A0ABD2M2H1_9BILA
MSKPLAERMKHLLSTGEDEDVYFLVGDGDEKELVPAHKLILKHSSDVFEAMFRFDAKKEKAEFATANCPVEVPDVEAAAFKVMLCFIYTEELNELNGENAMAVLYAAKKYNIPPLVNASLQIPISEFRNVFVALAQARLFELEDRGFNIWYNINSALIETRFRFFHCCCLLYLLFYFYSWRNIEPNQMSNTSIVARHCLRKLLIFVIASRNAKMSAFSRSMLALISAVTANG